MPRDGGPSSRHCGQNDAQDVIAERGRQHNVLLDAAPRLEEKELMAGDAGLRQAAQLLDPAVESQKVYLHSQLHDRRATATLVLRRLGN